MKENVEVTKVVITEIELADIPDCEFKTALQEVLDAEGKVVLKLKTPSEMRNVNPRKAKARCMWYAPWRC